MRRLISGLLIASLVAISFCGFLLLAEQKGIIFRDSFETSKLITMPENWKGGFGVVVKKRAYEGTRSLRMQGDAGGGSNLLRSISDLNIISGQYRFSFYMYVDTSEWEGTDGVAQGHLEVRGRICSIGLTKDGNEYKAWLYGSTIKKVTFPGTLDAWARYEMLIDLDENSVTYFINGVNLGMNWLGKSYESQINLNTGNAGYGGGTPAAYFDLITIERVH